MEVVVIDVIDNGIKIEINQLITLDALYYSIHTIPT
jgi:hypothetical protein